MYDNWECDFKTHDQELFLQVFWQSESCDVFIDEAGEMIGHYERTMIKTATQGRHKGHNVHFITQRPTQIAPTVRTQCSNLFLFAMAREDSEILAREWNKEELKEAAQLPRGQCIMASRFGPIKRLNVFT